MASASVTLRSSRNRIRQSGRRSSQRVGESGQHDVGAVLGGTDQQHLLLRGAQIRQRGVVGGQDPARVHDDPMTQFGEHHAPSGPLHDRRTDDGLDAPHMLADRRLGQMQNRRGAVKSATVGHRDDAAQRRDVQNLSHAAKVL